MDIDPMGCRISVNCSIGFVQFFHNLNCRFSGAHGHSDQFFHCKVIVCESFQCLNIKFIYLITVIAQFSCLMPIGADTFQPV